MCGRFVSATPPDELAEYFAADTVTEAVETALPGPSYNVAPTNSVWVVVDDDEGRRIDAFRWGLVPSWAKDLKVGSRMINARSETVTEKPSYRRALAKRRCIIPADGFFEWKVLGAGQTGGQGKKGPKQPYFIHRPDGEPYAFAGLWEGWYGGPAAKGSEEPIDPVWTCTILTGAPNSAMAQLHDRMPIILSRENWDLWLDPTVTDVEAVVPLMVPAPAELISFHPVSSDVNSVRNKDAALILEVPPLDAPEGD